MMWSVWRVEGQSASELATGSEFEMQSARLVLEQGVHLDAAEQAEARTAGVRYVALPAGGCPFDE